MRDNIEKMQTAISQWTENDETYEIIVKYGMRKIGDQIPYFSITSEISSCRGIVSCGCQHDEVQEHFPELGSLVRFHLVDQDGTPMHYVVNGKYWIKEGNMKHFFSTIIWTGTENEFYTKRKQFPSIDDFLMAHLENTVKPEFFKTMMEFNVEFI